MVGLSLLPDAAQPHRRLCDLQIEEWQAQAGQVKEQLQAQLDSLHSRRHSTVDFAELDEPMDFSKPVFPAEAAAAASASTGPGPHSPWPCGSSVESALLCCSAFIVSHVHNKML